MLIKKLVSASGVSGNENEIRQLILKEIEPYADHLKTDRLGNIIAFKKGSSPTGKNIMLAAHMDEVGLAVKSIDPTGVLKFVTVGGIDPRILVSKPVKIGDDKISGVIGAKAIHLQEPQERNEILKTKQLYIDIGATSKEDAEKHVKPGDYIVFDSPYREFGNALIKSKALDDRAGCAILIELMKKSYAENLYFAFTVQEEIGLRGASVAAYGINPDFAIVVEATTCFDMTDIEAPLYSTKMHHGPAISIMDTSSFFDKTLRNKAATIGDLHKIPYQFKQGVTGGNDAGAIHLAKEGVPTLSLSLPCRYIHSPSSVISKKDYRCTIDLIDKFLENIDMEEN